MPWPFGQARDPFSREAREKMAERRRAWWARLTPEERAQHAEAIAEGQRRRWRRRKEK